MARRRFYAPPDDIKDSVVTLSTEETHHLMRVIRMTPGDAAFVFDGRGNEYECSFRGVKGNCAQLEIAAALSDVVESPIELTLAQALAKGDKFDFIVQKATELGVRRLAPLVTRYGDVRPDDQQLVKRVERWRRISLEALKQCGRRTLMEIAAPRVLRTFLTETKPPAQQPSDRSQPDLAFLLFSERGGLALHDALAEVSTAHQIIALVGPEGGWSDDEFDLLTERGCLPVTLGPRVLRTETAAVVAITLIQHGLGDLSTVGR